MASWFAPPAGGGIPWRYQTATASPAASIPTCGLLASRSAGERSCGGPHAPALAGRIDACTTTLVPFERVQTSAASPAVSTAICGAAASWPGADRLSGGSQVGVAAAAGANASTARAAAQKAVVRITPRGVV